MYTKAPEYSEIAPTGTLTQLFSLGKSSTALTLWCAAISVIPLCVLLLSSAWDNARPPDLSIAGFITVVFGYLFQVLMSRQFANSMADTNADNLEPNEVWKLWFKSQGYTITVTVLPKVIGLFLVGLAYRQNNGWAENHGGQLILDGSVHLLK